MSDLFKQLGLGNSLIDGLKKENIIIPTGVQTLVIPEALQIKDLIVRSQTGTGKTLAYLLPLYEKISTKNEMQVIIIVPTHELAIQVQRQIETLSKNSGINIRSAVIIGNVNIERQLKRLKEKPQIIVGSAGRILEFIKKKAIPAHLIKHIVLDEADILLNNSNYDFITAIIKTTLKDRQLMLFSATMPNKIIEKAKEITNQALIIKEDNKLSVPTTIEHLYFIAEQRGKIEALKKLLLILQPKKAIVFINRDDEIERSNTKLNFHNINAEFIQGSNDKSERQRIMEGFRDGKINVLIASDLAARGLHIEGITHIINLSMPEKSENYLHRVGRTGRNENKGYAISIVTKLEVPLIKMYEKELNIKIEIKSMFKGEIVEKDRRHSLNSSTLNKGEKK